MFGRCVHDSSARVRYHPLNMYKTTPCHYGWGSSFAGSYPASMFFINNILSCALGSIIAGLALT